MGLLQQSQPGPGRQAWLDRLGVTASLGCVAHCVFTGLFFLFFPSLIEASHHLGIKYGFLSLLSSEWVHLILALVVFPVAIYSLTRGYLLHRRSSTITFGALGLILIAVGLYAHPHSLETMFTLGGGLSLALAHLINLKKLKSCEHRTVI